jgi:hypothetical protein
MLAIILRPDLSEEWFLLDGILLVRTALPMQRTMHIIEDYLSRREGAYCECRAEGGGDFRGAVGDLDHYHLRP